MLIRMDVVVTIVLFVLIGIVLYKVLIKKERPTSSYTPFDYITGQTDKEFHHEIDHEETDDMKE